MTSTFEKLQHGGFLVWYGSLLLEREEEVGKPVDITDDVELLERAFQGGWNTAVVLEDEAHRQSGR